MTEDKSAETNNEKLETELYNAIVDKDIPAVVTLAEQGVTLSGDSAKDDALDCGSNNLELLKTLLHYSIIAIDDRISKDNATLLHLACIGFPRVEVIPYLLSNIDPNVQTSGGETPLHFTLAFGRFPAETLKAVQLLLEAGANPNIADEKRKTPLMSAVALPEVFSELLSAGADPSATDRNGYSIIQKAAANSVATLKQLISLGMDAHSAAGLHKLTPFHVAVSYDRLDCVQELLAHGADVNQSDAEGARPLNTALWRDFGDITELLLKHGAVASSPDELEQAKKGFSDRKKAIRDAKKSRIHQAVDGKDSLTLLSTISDLRAQGSPPNIHSIAVDIIERTGHLASFRALIDLGLDIHHVDEGYTLLHDAVMNNRIDIARLLIDSGLDVNQVCGDGRTMFACATISSPEMIVLLRHHGMDRTLDADRDPISTALTWGHADVAQLLMGEGYPLDDRTLNNKDLIGKRLRDEDVDTIQFLLDQGLDIETRLSAYGSDISLLQYATLIDSDVIVKFLLERGANPNSRSSDNETIAEYALGKHSNSIVRLLFDNGADPNALIGSFSKSPLQAAIQSGNAQVAQFLIEKGADVTHLGDVPTSTPLHNAAARGYLQTSKMLVSAGANVLEANTNGKTALDIALENDNAAVAKYLREQEVPNPA